MGPSPLPVPLLGPVEPPAGALRHMQLPKRVEASPAGLPDRNAGPRLPARLPGGLLQAAAVGAAVADRDMCRRLRGVPGCSCFLLLSRGSRIALLRAVALCQLSRCLPGLPAQDVSPGLAMVLPQALSASHQRLAADAQRPGLNLLDSAMTSIKCAGGLRVRERSQSRRPRQHDAVDRHSRVHYQLMSQAPRCEA